MRQAFSIIVFLIFGFIGYGQKDSILGRQFQLTGKIIEKVQLTPPCGTIAWGTVIEFAVIELTGMSYYNKRIGIIVTCPEFYKDNFFEKGKMYHVVFSDKNQAGFEWLIPNKGLLKKNALSFDPYAVSINKIQWH